MWQHGNAADFGALDFIFESLNSCFSRLLWGCKLLHATSKPTDLRRGQLGERKGFGQDLIVNMSVGNLWQLVATSPWWFCSAGLRKDGQLHRFAVGPCWVARHCPNIQGTEVKRNRAWSYLKENIGEPNFFVSSSASGSEDPWPGAFVRMAEEANQAT